MTGDFSSMATASVFWRGREIWDPSCNELHGSPSIVCACFRAQASAHIYHTDSLMRRKSILVKQTYISPSVVRPDTRAYFQSLSTRYVVNPALRMTIPMLPLSTRLLFSSPSGSMVGAPPPAGRSGVMTHIETNMSSILR